jgi:hypothetical protein
MQSSLVLISGATAIAQLEPQVAHTVVVIAIVVGGLKSMGLTKSPNN